MTVTPFEVQKVLRTYSRQLNRSRRLLQNKIQPEPKPPDSVKISAKARRLHVLKRIAADMIQDMGRQNRPDTVEREALDRLGEEYGENLALVRDDDGSMLLAVVDSQTGEIQRQLPVEESNHLTARLPEITMEIIDRNMMGGHETE